MIASAYRSHAARRSTEPFTLHEASRFSKMTASYDAAFVVDALKNYARVYAPLCRVLDAREYTGPCRPRKPGRYELLYIYFAKSSSVDVFEWYYSKDSKRDMWINCGFDPKGVSYATVQRRFAELENYEEAFDTALAHLVRTARRHVPEIGAWIHTDATEASTSARFHHDCQPGEGCKGHYSDNVISLKAAAEIRRSLAKIPEETEDVDEDEDDDDNDDGSSRKSYIQHFECEPGKKRARQPIRRVFRQGHWWASTDLEAGTRKIGTKKLWDGYNADQAIDHVTGIAIQTRIHPADVNETNSYPDLIDRVIQTTGARPIAIAGDRAYDITSIYEYNSALGIGTAAVRRTKQYPPEGIDRDKVPLCKHCGGGCDFESFVEIGDGKYELRFRCALPTSASCERLQSRSATTDPKHVVPLWASNPIFVMLTKMHQSFERWHFVARRRSKTGPDSHTAAPRRTGIACQQLRATVTNMLNWLVLCLKFGWIRGRKAFAPAEQVYSTGAWTYMYAKRVKCRRHTGVLGGDARVRRE